MKIVMQRHSPTRADTNELSYLLKNVKLNPTNDIDDQKKFAFEKLAQEKKLSLVLDLDHTLIHSLKINRLTPEDRDLVLKETVDPSLMRSLFRIKFSENDDYVVKLRPGLGQFLERASKMFKLHVFTKGSRYYAMEILKLIDPEDYYFGCKSSSSSSSSTRVFTRESCVLGKKSLDLVMAKESGILIVDDKIRVWRDVDQENVLEIPRYDFFKLGSGGQRLSEGVLEGSDESENEGWLIKYFRVCKAIHALFFYSQRAGRVLERDVRVLKKELVDRFETVNVVGLAAMISSIVS